MSSSYPTLPRLPTIAPIQLQTNSIPFTPAAQKLHRTPTTVAPSTQHHRNVSFTPSPQPYAPTPIPRATQSKPIARLQQRSAPTCSSCGSTSLRENNLGYLICQDCGAQSQEHMAITQEVEEEMFGNMKNILRTGTRMKRATAKVIKLTPHEDELVRSQLLLHGFHCLLQYQCRTLVLNFGVPPMLIGIVGRLFVSYLAEWRDAPGSQWGVTHLDMIVRRYVPGMNLLHGHGPKKAEKSLTKSKSSAHQEDEQMETRSTGSTRSQTAAAASTTKRSLKRSRSEADELDELKDSKESIFKKQRSSSSATISDDLMYDVDEDDEDVPNAPSPTPSTAAAAASLTHSSRNGIKLGPGDLSMALSISFLYLACHLLREPITMQQLCTWIQLGRLPFFNVRTAIPPPMWIRIARDPKLLTFFMPQTLPFAARLLTLAQNTAESIASQMERVVESQMQQVETDDQIKHQAQLTYQQAQQLRSLVAPPTASPGATDEDISPSPSVLLSTATSNSSLLLRTWLEQLRLPSELHPLIMEIVSQLDILPDSTVIKGNRGRPRKNQTNADGSAAAKMTAAKASEQQILLMACLVLSVQLTYGTGTNSTASVIASSRLSAPNPTPSDVPGIDLSHTLVAPSPAVDSHLIARTRALTTARSSQPAPTSATNLSLSADGTVTNATSSTSLPQFLSKVLQQPTTLAGSSTTPAAACATATSSTIAANWSTSTHGTDWPRTIHAARTLPIEDQTPFIEWLGQTVMSRLEPPKDFEFYLEQFKHVAAQRKKTPSKLSTRSILPTLTAPIPTTGIISRLACEEVVNYAMNRSGLLHPIYSLLLDRCALLLGIPSAQLHAATQRVIQLAKTKHGQGSVYVNTKQIQPPPPPHVIQAATLPVATSSRPLPVSAAPSRPVANVSATLPSTASSEPDDQQSQDGGTARDSFHSSVVNRSSSSVSSSSSVLTPRRISAPPAPAATILSRSSSITSATAASDNSSVASSSSTPRRSFRNR